MCDVPSNFCKKLTKSGKPCKAPPTESGLCYFHANPDKARTLGRKGGRKNRYPVTDVAVPEDITLTSLAAILDQALGELLAGRLQPRVATALAQLVNTWRRLTETMELERRIRQLERQSARDPSNAAELPTASETRDVGFDDAGEAPRSP